MPLVFVYVFLTIVLMSHCVLHRKISQCELERAYIERVPDNIPNVLIIGAQKSGTSYFNRLMSDQTGIQVYPKEQHYFAGNKTPIGIYSTDPFHPNIQDYSKQLLKQGILSRQKHVLVEKTPEYMFFPEEIVHVMPRDTKYIVLLRDPINRAFSAFKQLKRKQNRFENASFDSMLLHPKKYGIHCERSPFHILNRGKYEIYLSRWLVHVDPQNILIIFFEDLKHYDWSTVTHFLNLETPIKITRIFRTSDYYNSIGNETLKRLETYFQPHNKALCRLLKAYNYKCPRWATYKET